MYSGASDMLGRRPGESPYDQAAKRARTMLGYGAAAMGAAGTLTAAFDPAALGAFGQGAGGGLPGMGIAGGGLPGMAGVAQGAAGGYDRNGLGMSGLMGAGALGAGGLGSNFGPSAYGAPSLAAAAGGGGSSLLGAGRGVPGMISMVGTAATAGSRPLPVVKCRGLPFSCEESDLVEFFSGLEVVDTLLVRKEGKFTGEALVVFASMMHAEAALQRNRMNMGRRYVEIFRSRRADYYNSIASEVAQDGGTYKGPEPAATKAAVKGALGLRPSAGGDAPPGTPALVPAAPAAPLPENASPVLKLRGLPYSATKQDIVEFFAGFGAEEGNVHLVLNAEGRSTGEAYVEFTSPAEAAAGMAKDRQLVGSRYVELFHCTQEDAAKGLARVTK